MTNPLVYASPTLGIVGAMTHGDDDRLRWQPLPPTFTDRVLNQARDMTTLDDAALHPNLVTGDSGHYNSDVMHSVPCDRCPMMGD